MPLQILLVMNPTSLQVNSLKRNHFSWSFCGKSVASVFGEQHKLGPMKEDSKKRWRKEVDWLLSITDHIVEFVPVQHTARDGSNMEVLIMCVHVLVCVL